MPATTAARICARLRFATHQDLKLHAVLRHRELPKPARTARRASALSDSDELLKLFFQDSDEANEDENVIPTDRYERSRPRATDASR